MGPGPARGDDFTHAICAILYRYEYSLRQCPTMTCTARKTKFETCARAEAEHASPIFHHDNTVHFLIDPKPKLDENRTIRICATLRVFS